MRKRRAHKKPVVNLDSARAKEEVIVDCMFEDCKHRMKVNLVDRINALDDILCKRCGRDFLHFYTSKGEIIYYGESYELMCKDHLSANIRREKRVRGKKK
jgi:hypothetical protein